MIRKAVLMKVFKNSHEEYKKRHDEIWEELAKTLKEYGASNYSIFLDEDTSNLFAYLEIENEEVWKTISTTEIVKKWWDFMADIMETNPDNSPCAKELKDVFYLK